MKFSLVNQDYELSHLGEAGGGYFPLLKIKTVLSTSNTIKPTHDTI
jgi:hypothetical protein